MSRSGGRAPMRAAALACLSLMLLAGCTAGSGHQAPAGASLEPAMADCLSPLGDLALQSASIADVQAGLSAGRFTRVQLVDAYAARIAAFDALGGPGPKVNSVQEVSATARAQAAALDARS